MILDLDQWIATFRPQHNHLKPHDSSFDDGNGGMMYETYGAELDYVVDTANGDGRNRVWTYVDGHAGTYIINGYQIVNRIGYFVTEIPCEKGVQYEVAVSVDDDSRHDA